MCEGRGKQCWARTSDHNVKWIDEWRKSTRKMFGSEMCERERKTKKFFGQKNINFVLFGVFRRSCLLYGVQVYNCCCCRCCFCSPLSSLTAVNAYTLRTHMYATSSPVMWWKKCYIDAVYICCMSMVRLLCTYSSDRFKKCQFLIYVFSIWLYRVKNKNSVFPPSLPLPSALLETSKEWNNKHTLVLMRTKTQDKAIN